MDPVIVGAAVAVAVSVVNGIRCSAAHTARPSRRPGPSPADGDGGERHGGRTQYVSMLRAAVADDPDHPRATALVGELSIHSADFRRLWARHDVRENVHGTTLFQHPEVGGITLDWDTYPLPGNPGPVLLVFTAEPGTPDAERLQLLASLRATRDTASRRPWVGGVPSRRA